MDEKTCAGCGGGLSRRNTSGRCRRCFWGPLNNDPARTEQRIAKLRETLAKPEHHERLVETCRANSRVRLGWCPPELQDEYRRLTRSKMLPAAEARAVIEDQVAREKAAATLSLSDRIAASHDRMKRGGTLGVWAVAHG